MRAFGRGVFVMVAVLLATPLVASSQTLTAVWDPNPSSDNVVNYEVCIGTTSLTCNFRDATVPASQTTYTFIPNPGVLYRVAVRAISAAGPGVYSPEVSVSIPSLSVPANRTSTVSVPITPLTLTASDPDGGTLQYTHTGLPFGLTLNPSTGAISGTPTSVGTFNVTVFVTDGLATASAAFVWTIQNATSDTTAPTLSITSHTNNQTVSAANITLSGTATDSGAGGSGVAGVTVNGAAATGGTATTSNTANWSRALTLVNGANVLTVVATDGAGNARTSQITVNLSTAPADTAAPTLTIASHTTGQTVNTSSITLSGTATDSASGGNGIASVTVNGSAATGGTATGNNTANWSRSVNLVSGANVLTVVATDTSGNARQSQITVNRDSTAPTVAITSHTSGSTVTTPNITLSGTATDSGAGGNGVTNVTVNGVAATGNTATGSNTANWSRALTLAAGSNTLTVVATDGAGNARTSSINLTYALPDTTAPALSITSHSAGEVVTTSSITLGGTATDSGAGGSGITSVTVNGASATGGTVSGSSTANWSRALTLATGSNTITVAATDGAGNTRTASISLTFTPPVVPMTAAALTPNVASPQVTGTTVTFTAAGGGGTAPYEYQWYVQQNGGAWVMQRGWSTTTTLAWTPASAGNYTVAIWARSAGSTANVWQAYAERAYSITDPAPAPAPAPPAPTPTPSTPMTMAWLTSSVASPQNAGATVTFTANGSGGTAPYEYQWYLQQNGGAWQLVRSWSTTTTYAWTPSSAGTYVMALWARSSGSTANVWQAYAERAFTINDPAPAPAPAPAPSPSPTPSTPMSSAYLGTNVASPQSTGATVTFTASGAGGTAPYEYQWYLQQNGGAWQMVRSWSTTTTYSWTPSAAGNYVMALWARSAGSSSNVWQAYAERAFSITDPAPAPAPAPAPSPTPTPTPSTPMTAATLASNVVSPQTAGSTVTFTAAGFGGTAPYEYQWYLQMNGGTWSMVRSWSTTNTYTWTPAAAGTYVMAIWARSSGSTANAWQAYADRTFVIEASATPPPAPAPAPTPTPTPGLPMTSAAVSPNLVSPQTTGTPVTFTASGSGGSAPYEYQWYLQQNGGSWQLLRGWSTLTTYTWTPSTAGTYIVALWARSAGSTANVWQAYAETWFTISAPAVPNPAPTPPPPTPTISTPMSAAWLSTVVLSPQRSSTSVTFYAGGSGGTAPYEYQWYVQKDGGVWQLARAWSTTTTYTLPTGQPGTYVVAIWARSAGSTANAWQAYGERTFVITP